MFGLNKLFGSGAVEEPKPEAGEPYVDSSASVENDIYGLVEPFSQLVPSIGFTADNIMKIIDLAKLSKEEVATVSGALNEGIIDENDELDVIRGRLSNAAKLFKDGIRE